MLDENKFICKDDYIASKMSGKLTKLDKFTKQLVSKSNSIVILLLAHNFMCAVATIEMDLHNRLTESSTTGYRIRLILLIAKSKVNDIYIAGLIH